MWFDVRRCLVCAENGFIFFFFKLKTCATLHLAYDEMRVRFRRTTSSGIAGVSFDVLNIFAFLCLPNSRTRTARHELKRSGDVATDRVENEDLACEL